MKVLGLIIGKAIFDRISVNCYFDRTILRQICGGILHLEDVYTYDQDVSLWLIKIYKTIDLVLNNLGSSQLALDFCIYHSNPGDKDLKVIELIPNGTTVMVKDENKEQYAELL